MPDAGRLLTPPQQKGSPLRGALHVCLSNSVNPGAGRIESNKIGLRTCAKIMAQMSGSFKRYTESGKFTAEVILPILPAGDPDGSS